MESRSRIRQACEACRISKRKCDGHHPCGTCKRYNAAGKCHFDVRRQKHTVSKRRDAISRSHVCPRQSSAVSDDSAYSPLENEEKSIAEASSGVSFPAQIAKRSDPSDAYGLRPLSWNLGLRDDLIGYPAIAVPRSINREEMRSSSRTYFETFHPVFGFVDEVLFEAQCEKRWSQTMAESTDSYDAVIYGVAALGSLFSGGSTKEDTYVQNARIGLEHPSFLGAPTSEHVAGWILRTSYLRSTYQPHAAWMAGSITMHVIEAVDAHSDEVGQYTKAASRPQQSTEYRRRQYWIARSLNTWTSYEYGRSPSEVRNSTCQSPSPIPGSHTTDVSTLYHLSRDAEATKDPAESYQIMNEVYTFTPNHDAVTLDRAYLMICICRKTKLVTAANKCEKEIISAGSDGLQAAARLAVRGQPWWHVVNVPFQFFCLMIAFDTRESLPQLGEASKTLETVAQHFDTKTVRKALGTARTLAHVFHKRKQEDLQTLAEIMARSASVEGGGQREITTNGISQEVERIPMAVDFRNTPETAQDASGLYCPGLDSEFANLDWNFLFGSNGDFSLIA